jgi:2-oxoisovalerate dehydrogenase E2 component (dihydrolipoyl transacylase)
MPDIRHFALPDVGEGLTEADILSWRVQPGDAVVVNQIVVEIETAKAAVELPSPWAGTVAELHAAEGDTVDVGRPIISIDVAGSATPPEAPRQSVLVGYGPRAETAPRRRARTTAAVQAPPPPESDLLGAPPESGSPELPAERHRVLAKPPVRKLAKSLGVDLADVPATGPAGTISRADVEGAANGLPVQAAATGSAVAVGRRETRIPIRGVRKHTAAAMVTSAFTAPHVTEFLTVDMTATMELRDRIARRPEFRDLKVSPLVLVARAVLLAAKRTPEINASWDEAAGEIVLKHYVNLGIAAATDRGLVVPNVKDADQLSLRDLTAAIGLLADTARSGRTAPADMAGGTITITNVGVFGVDSGTPILNPGESGIVCFGAVRRMPWVVTGSDGSERLEPRWVSQLSVSFDHRLVDGQQGSRFLADVGDMLVDPGLALL